ncbi:alpha/beta hydrolase family protein [Burkholderia lata]|uniref:alpha/beta hydrolase family protein n=1 Tax=Burkholderia lata (strain ATCC 17760 / DSM 23089 / LMG 22485 / NCIMB 9086 / R18194 / 383) TaxID=482957 RepID=UPI0005A18ACA|nr:alpha/beta hydrolase [Burkholderia lata]
MTALLLSAVAGARAEPVSLETYLVMHGPTPDTVVHYGPAPSQVVDFFRPPGQGPFPVAILVHGGCWQSRYGGRLQLRVLAAQLARQGIAVWNVEYRRIDEPGGGYPGTYQDIGAAVDLLDVQAASLDLDSSRVVAVGHSAGAQLAVWAASRARLPRGSALFVPRPLSIPTVVSLGGLLDLRSDANAIRESCGIDIAALTGMPSELRPDVLSDTSPASLVPNDMNVIAITGALDSVAPPGLARRYVALVQRAGGSARAIVVPDANHLDEVIPDSPVWPILDAIVLDALRVPSRQGGHR